MPTEATILAWCRGYDRDMDKLCQALMWQLCNEFGTAPSPPPLTARAAWKRSVIVSRDPAAAPPGAFHYWTGIPDGHVGLSLGGGRVLMASSKVTEMIGHNVGITTVSVYTARTHLIYQGWSHTNANGDLAISGAALAPAAPPTSTPVLPRPEDEEMTADDRAALDRMAVAIGRLEYDVHTQIKPQTDKIPGLIQQVKDQAVVIGRVEYGALTKVPALLADLVTYLKGKLK